MCSSCGYPAAPGHWTEAGASETHDRLRARFQRAQILKHVLKPFGLSAHDGIHVPGIQLSNHFGNHVIVRDLAELWKEAECMTGVAIDPLDPRLIGEAS